MGRDGQRLLRAEKNPKVADLHITAYIVMSGADGGAAADATGGGAVHAPAQRPPAAGAAGGSGLGRGLSSRRRQFGVVRSTSASSSSAATTAITRPSISRAASAPPSPPWVSVASNDALAAVRGPRRADHSAAPAEQRKKAADRNWTLAMAAIKLQSACRAFAVRRRQRLAACDLRHSIVIRVHELRLPSELATSEMVHAAALHLEVAGMPLVTASHRAGTLRARAGRLALFEVITTIDLERDSPAYAKLAEVLASPLQQCELKATLTGERLAPVDPSTGLRRNLGNDARYTMGEARVDLKVLLATGSDMVEKPVPVRSKARRGALAKAASSPLLVLSLEGVDALDAIVRAGRLFYGQQAEAELGGAAMTARQAGVRTLSVGGKGGTAAAATGAASKKKPPAPTRQLLVARDIALQRMQKASLVQAIWRGLHARRRMRAGAAQLPPTRAEPGLEHVQLLVRVTAVRAVDDGGMMGGGLAVGYDASGGGGFAAEMFLGPGHEFAIEIDAGEMARSAERADVVSSGWQPLPLPRAPEEAPAPIGLALDLKHGGRARTAMREALHRREHHERPSVLISLLVAPEGHAARIGAQVAEGTQRARKANRAAKLRNALDDAPARGGGGGGFFGGFGAPAADATAASSSPATTERRRSRRRRLDLGGDGAGDGQGELDGQGVFGARGAYGEVEEEGRRGVGVGRERATRPRVGGGAPRWGGAPVGGGVGATTVGVWRGGARRGLADVPPHPRIWRRSVWARRRHDGHERVWCGRGWGRRRWGWREFARGRQQRVTCGLVRAAVAESRPHDDEQWVVERWVDFDRA